MIFKQKNKKVADLPDVLIDSQKINHVKSSKFLGVIINESLTWTDHISIIKDKVSKSIGIIKCIRKRLPPSVLKLLYYTMINPYYEYCNIIWASGSNWALDKLIKTQKRAIRMLGNLQWNSHTDPFFYKFNILKIGELHKLQVACFMFKVNQGLMPQYFLQMFTTNAAVHSYNTRQKEHYHMAYCRTNLKRTTIRVAGTKLWNTITDHIKNAKTISQFRSRYKKYLLTHQGCIHQ